MERTEFVSSGRRVGGLAEIGDIVGYEDVANVWRAAEVVGLARHHITEVPYDYTLRYLDDQSKHFSDLRQYGWTFGKVYVPEGKRLPITSAESQSYIDAAELPDATPPTAPVLWTDEHQQKAQAEGWAIFNLPDDPDIERDDDLDLLATDRDAWLLCAEKTLQGSETHLRALVLVRRHNDPHWVEILTAVRDAWNDAPRGLDLIGRVYDAIEAENGDDGLPVCEACGVKVTDDMTAEFAPFCSAECQAKGAEVFTLAEEGGESSDECLGLPEENEACDPCPKGDPDCETGDDGSCHDACEAPRPLVDEYIPCAGGCGRPVPSIGGFCAVCEAPAIEEVDALTRWTFPDQQHSL